MFALLARVEFESTLGTLPDWSRQILEQVPALRTAGNCAGTRHIQWPRAERIIPSRTCGLLQLFLSIAAGVLVPALSIFPIRQEHPPLNRLILRFSARPHNTYSGQPDLPEQTYVSKRLISDRR